MIERLDLRPGATTCRLINGAWQLSAGHDLAAAGGTDGHDRERRAVLDHLCRLVDAGLDTFDCADIYTGVEELLGALRARRPAIRVHTKFVPDRAALASLDRAYVASIIDRSLRRLRVDALDLVQFHWWDYDVPGMVDTAGWLDDLRRSGKIRHLGVTNFDRPHLAQLVEAGVPIVSHQCQFSLLDRRPARAVDASARPADGPSLRDYCRTHDIHLLAYGTVAGGFLSDRWLGQPEPSRAANRSLVKYALIIDEFGGWSHFQRVLQTLADIGRRHAADATAVAVRWVLDQAQVAAAIVGARSARHVASNLAVFDLRLTDQDRADIDRVLAGAAGPGGPVFGLERADGGPHQRIMKTDLNQA